MKNPLNQSTRVSIYGSCVSRDTFDFLPSDFLLDRYVARQSLLSMSNDASAHWADTFQLSSQFQQRMVEKDWAGSAWWDIRTSFRNLDLLLWDLTDERHGVYRFEDGTYVTRSIEMVGTELEEVTRAAQYIPFGSDEHFLHWRTKAIAFSRSLKNANLFPKTLVLNVDWATHSLQGIRTPPSMGLDAEAANKLYARYYKYLELLGLKVISVPDYLIWADLNHKWGFAAFHYIPEVYDELNRQIQDFVAT